MPTKKPKEATVNCDAFLFGGDKQVPEFDVLDPHSGSSDRFGLAGAISILPLIGDEGSRSKRTRLEEQWQTAF